MKKVGIIGHFGFGHDLLNGQTIKTKIISSELKKEYGVDNVWEIDTHGGVVSYLKIPFMVLFSLVMCQNVIILPAQNGLRIIAPILYMLNVFFRRKTHYVVIGGWMPSLIKNNVFLCGCLKRLDRIYVETSVMRDLLISMGFLNIVIMSNCKPLKIVEKECLPKEPNKPLKFCLFSRVMKQKGIEHAIYAINQLNAFYGVNTCCLDIYGQIDEREKMWFENLQKSFSEDISYGGVVDFDKSVDTLKCYDALIFPTLFYTEGIPGTIIDAYAAGIPVISSRWASFSDVVDDGIVGFGYEFGSQDALFELMKNIVSRPNQLVEMKCFCVDKAENFLPCNAMRVLKNNLN